jgi:hypothetical protein
MRNCSPPNTDVPSDPNLSKGFSRNGAPKTATCTTYRILFDNHFRQHLKTFFFQQKILI